MARQQPVTWNDVATKDDLHVRERTPRSEVHALDAGLRGEIANAITIQTKWMVAFPATWGTFLIAAVRLLP